MAIISESAYVFIVSFGEISSCFSYVRLTIVWECYFVYFGGGKFVVVMGFAD
jgi:hypothetical protein